MFWLNYQMSKSEGQTNLNMPLQNIQEKIATAYWSNLILIFLRKKQGKHKYVLMHQHFAKTNIGFHIEMIIPEVYLCSLQKTSTNKAHLSPRYKIHCVWELCPNQPQCITYNIKAVKKLFHSNS